MSLTSLHTLSSASPRRSKSEIYIECFIFDTTTRAKPYIKTYLVVHLSAAPHPPRSVVVEVRGIRLPLEEQFILQVRVDLTVYLEVDRLLVLRRQRQLDITLHPRISLVICA